MCAFRTLFLTLFGLLAVVQARADVIISNYPPTNDNDRTTVASITGMFASAQGFTLPAGPAYSLDSATLRLERNNLNAVLQLELFGDSGGNPVGPSLVSFTIPPFPLGTSDVTFLPAMAFTLQPLSTYWLAATGSSPTNDGIVWLGSIPLVTPVGIAIPEPTRFDTTGIYPPTTIFNPSFFSTYQVNGTPQVAAVPEPATLLLFGASLGGLALACRRRR